MTSMTTTSMQQYSLQFRMWHGSFVALITSIHLWTLVTVVRCDDGHCTAVEMYQSMTFNCIQSTMSSDRFVLWYYSNDSSQENVAMASCYFNESCRINDGNPELYSITSRSDVTHADTQLTIRNVSADHHGWTLLCYVWDAILEGDVMYVTEAYRLQVYRLPGSVECNSGVVREAGDVTVTCRISDVFPTNISCRMECEGYSMMYYMAARYHPSETRTNAECEASLKLDSHNVQCRVSVFTSECGHKLRTLNVNLTHPGARTMQQHKEEHQLGQQQNSNGAVNFGSLSYVISALVAVIVIPVSFCTLFVVCRQWRRYRRDDYHSQPSAWAPSIQFPLYTQQSTCAELVSANETAHSSDDSDEWSTNSSNIYSNLSSNISVNDNTNRGEGDPPSTLPFTIDGAEDTVRKSIESHASAPLPAPHVRKLVVPRCADAEERMRLIISQDNDVQGRSVLAETNQDELSWVPPSSITGNELVDREFPESCRKYPESVSRSLESPVCACRTAEMRFIQRKHCCQRDVVNNECVHRCQVDVNEGSESCRCKFPRNGNNDSRDSHNETSPFLTRGRRYHCSTDYPCCERRHRHMDDILKQQQTEKRHIEVVLTEDSFLPSDDVIRGKTMFPRHDASTDRRCCCHENCVAVAGHYFDPSASSSTRSIDRGVRDGTGNVHKVTSDTTVIVDTTASQQE